MLCKFSVFGVGLRQDAKTDWGAVVKLGGHIFELVSVDGHLCDRNIVGHLILRESEPDSLVRPELSSPDTVVPYSRNPYSIFTLFESFFDVCLSRFEVGVFRKAFNYECLHLFNQRVGAYLTVNKYKIVSLDGEWKIELRKSLLLYV